MIEHSDYQGQHCILVKEYIIMIQTSFHTARQLKENPKLCAL